MLANGFSASKKYTQEEVEELVAKSPYYKATSNDVDWLQKVRMQGRIQKWVDHSISVTINLPADVTEDLVNSLYVEVRFTVTVPAQVYCCLRITRRRKKKIATVWSRRLSWLPVRANWKPTW